jgi:hypothetical protein
VIIPPPINSKGLHKLDVDADIWLNFNMDEETIAEFGGHVPPWLGDEAVCKGIQFMQDVVNCHEELAWCQQELILIQRWFTDKYTTYQSAVAYTHGNSSVSSD